jgi:hypothetical protein
MREAVAAKSCCAALPRLTRRSSRPAPIPVALAASDRGHKSGSMRVDLSDEETAAPTQELHDIIDTERYPFLPRIRTLESYSLS